MKIAFERNASRQVMSAEWPGTSAPGVGIPDCAELQKLSQAAANASWRSGTLLKEYGRLRGITGLSVRQLLDLIDRAVEAKRTADAALAEHAATHRCK